MNELITLLVYLLVAAIVLYVVHLVIGMLALPSQVKTIALIVVGLVALLWILNTVGVFVF